MDSTFRQLLKDAWGDEWGHYRLIPRKAGLPKRSLMWAKADGDLPPQPEHYDLYWSTASDKNPQNPHKKSDHSTVRIVWVDIDDTSVDKYKLFEAGMGDPVLPTPNYIITTSPGKAHFIYVLDRAVKVTTDSIASIETLQKSLCELIGGDTASTDLGHISRVPGTTNYKYDGEGRVNAQIERMRTEPYSLAELNPGALRPGEGQHEYLKKELARAAARGQDVGQVAEQVRDTMFLEPMDEDEFNGLVQWAENSDVAATAPMKGTRYADIPYWDKKAKGVPNANDYVKALEATGVEIHHDLMGGGLVVDGAPLTDAEFSHIYVALHSKGYQRKEIMHQTLEHMAGMQEPYSRILDFFSGTKYNGQDHIAHLASHFTEGSGMFETYLRRWLIGCIAKLKEPVGAQNRMLVLEGPQGIGKSEFVRWLVPPALRRYYTEQTIDTTTKDTEILATRIWIWEVAELEAITTKQDVGRLKAFLTKSHTTERPAYGRYFLDEVLRASFIGTTNAASGFLTDGSGSRRYMAVTIEAIDWKGYVANVDVRQVWAQAEFLYDQGKPWELTEDEAAEADELNTAFLYEDPLVHRLEKMYDVDESFETYVLTTDVHAALADPRVNVNSVANALQRMGARNTRIRIDGKQKRVWMHVKRKEYEHEPG